ncbi:hypothetical protein Tco_1057573 [Tanacetum coccineum]|uniref:Uncharacterized protein n=1 Tax=Tanacetum coccineum TaxID=301880 RepID=A0ABQ5H6Q5_9ASTR
MAIILDRHEQKIQEQTRDTSTPKMFRLEEKVWRFRMFDNGVHQMHHDNHSRCLIHSGDVIDWEFLANHEQNRNPSSPKRVHFVNSIIILNKEDEAKEKRCVKSSTTKYKDHETTIKEEEEVESDEEFDEGTEEEELHYNWIMSNRLEPRRKPSNTKKSYNFVEKVRGLKVFIGNFTYKCNFMVLEDTTSVIDHDLGSVVFGKLFMETIGHVYDIREGIDMFEKDKEKIMFKMPHKMEMFKHIDFTDIKIDGIPPFVIESDDDNSEKPTTRIA